MRFPVPARALRVLMACLPVLAFAGCPSDPDSDSPGDFKGYTEADAAARGWAEALRSMRIDDLEALLAPDFQYFPASTDLSGIDWLTAASWSRAAELDMLSNIMNPAFVSRVNGHSVQSLPVDLEVTSVEETPEGTVVHCHALLKVLWAENAGAISDVRLDMLMVKDADGYFRMQWQRELPAAALRSPAVEATSWADAKALFRDPEKRNVYVEAAPRAWAAALEARRADLVDTVLDPAFVFYPVAWDLPDFPWMTGDSWSRAEEMGMIAHMCDSTFVSPANGQSVDSITATLEVQSILPATGGTLIRTHAFITVLWGPSSGAVTDVRLEFLVVAGEDGYFRIASQRELPLIAGRSMEPASWGSVKALYR